MQEKIGQIEEQLSQLSTDIAQLLGRVDALRQSLSELKAEADVQPSEPIVIEPEVNEETTEADKIETEYEPVEETTVEQPQPFDDSELTPVTEQPESESLDQPIQEMLEPELPELPEPHQEEPQQPEESEVEIQIAEDDIEDDESEPEFPPLPPIPPLAAAEDGGVDVEELRKLFTINDNYRFRRELFGNDGIAMSDTINMIAAMRSMAEVEDYVYSDLEWDKENDDVRAFMDIITFYFMQKR